MHSPRNIDGLGSAIWLSADVPHGRSPTRSPRRSEDVTMPAKPSLFRVHPRRACIVLPSIAAVGATLLLSPARPAAGAGSGIRTVFVIMMENTGWSTIKGNTSQARYINRTLIKNYASADNYRSGYHPSLPNYVALESADPMGMTNGSYLPTDHSINSTSHLTTYLAKAAIS